MTDTHFKLIIFRTHLFKHLAYIISFNIHNTLQVVFVSPFYGLLHKDKFRVLVVYPSGKGYT